MSSHTLQTDGSLYDWDLEQLIDLRDHLENNQIGQTVLMENEDVRVWSTVLQPGQRLPFHRHDHDYSWTCLSNGFARSKYQDGKVVTINYHHGDHSFYNHQEKGSFVHDLENIGITELKFITVEYLN